MLTVLKIGGSILSGDSAFGISGSYSRFKKEPAVIVHGGGPAVNELCGQLGIEPRFITSPSGIRSRLTDHQTMQAYVMAMRGKINSEIVLSLHKSGIKAIGLSGIDGPILTAERKKRLLTMSKNGRKMFIDGGYTGRIVRCDTVLLKRLVQDGYVPVISPIAMSTEHEALNVDGDRAASAIAGSLGADRLILLTDVDGVLLDGELVSRIRSHELPELIKKVGNGMDKKLMAASEAINAGCREVIISSGKVEDPLGNALASEKRTVVKA